MSGKIHSLFPIPHSLRFSRFVLTIIILSLAALSPAQGTNRAAGRVTLEFLENGKRQSQQLYGESHALLIGVSDYTNGWPDLPGVKTDISAVATALAAHGFTLTTVMDPNAEQLRAAYNDFINRYGRQPDARLLLYFAGHGHTLKLGYGDDMGYIVPTDAPNPNRDVDGFKTKALDMEMIEVYAKRIESKHALFMFDSCFSGSIFDLSREAPPNITDKTTRPVRQFITSGSADETVPDRSIFRGQFIEAIDSEGDLNKDGYVTGAELGEFLHAKVTNYSQGTQHPQSGKIRNPRLDKGDFVFELGKKEPAPPVVQDVPDFSADDLIQQARQREEAEKAQLAYIAKAKEAWSTLEQIETNQYISARDKAAKYQEYLDKFGDANWNRDQAADRLERWKNYRTPTPTPLRTERPASRPSTASGRQDETMTLDLGSGVTMDMVYIPAGTFTMGSPSNEKDRDDDEGPQTRVTLSEGLWMGKTEVTQAQWKAVMGNNPSKFKGDDLPVETVSWNDAMDFCRKLSSKTGRDIALPTEAQWEYACRAGTTTAYSFGDSDSRLGDYAWYTSNAGSKTHPVGSKRANPWGLYDMHGNVWEWCADWYEDEYPGGSATDPTGPNTGSVRVFRGGSWSLDPRSLRSAYRDGSNPDNTWYILGFRVSASQGNEF